MDSIVQEQRQQLARRREEALKAHRGGADGFTVCAALTSAIDDVIVALAGSAVKGNFSGMALYALGGYGRNELCPKSDIDIMVLHADAAAAKKLERSVQQLLHSFWDCGLDIGHSVRSIDECMAFAGTEVENWASILEARFLCGDAEADARFRRRRAETVERKSGDFFIRTILDELDSRHAKYGNSAKLLEPNIKKSAGGLRDLHALLWLYRATGVGYLNGDADPHRSACLEFLTLLANEHELETAESVATASALEFLLRTRNEIHFQRETLHDSIDYALQSRIAEGLGYRESGNRQGVELFMQEYYLSAKRSSG